MAAEKGNQYGIKLKKPDTRQAAYKSYCEHIAKGNPKQSWFYNDGKHSVCWRTMDKYIKENPEEFHPFLLSEAQSKRYEVWLEEGKKLMRGTYRNGSPIVWQTIMRNIFRDIGWDQQGDPRNSDPAAIEAAARLMTQIAHAQRAQQKNAEQAEVEPAPIEIDK